MSQKKNGMITKNENGRYQFLIDEHILFVTHQHGYLLIIKMTNDYDTIMIKTIIIIIKDYTLQHEPPIQFILVQFPQ